MNPAESEDAQRRVARREGKGPPRRQDSFSDVWGHLPERVRDRLMNLKGDRYLPKYDDLIRRYYESLTQP